MQCTLKYPSMGFALFVLALLSGCPDAVEDASNTPTAQERFSRNLAGSWLYPGCYIDLNSQIFHGSREYVFTAAGGYKVVSSLYAGSSCDVDPVARATYIGSYTIGKKVTAPFQNIPGKNAAAREIDYHIERSETEGHRVLVQTLLSLSIPKTYYDIIYVEGDFRYDGDKGYSDSVSERSIQLDDEYKRTSGLKGRTALASPNFDSALTVANLAATWVDECFEDSAGEGFYQNYQFTFASTNTVSVKSALWSTDDCTGAEKASITFNGTFALVDNVVTAVSKANATRIEFTLGAGTYAGDTALTSRLPLSNALEGKTYFLGYYDATYDLFFYGGWFEASLAALPTDIEYGIAKLGRAPLPRTATTRRESR